MRTSMDRGSAAAAEAAAALRLRYSRRPKLAALLQSYVARYPEFVRNLREWRARDDIRSIEELAHRLSGSAGSFGFPDVSDAARRCEGLAAGGAPRPALDAALAELESLMLAATEYVAERA